MIFNRSVYKCPHCDAKGPAGEDHSCSCPYSDENCPNHIIRTCKVAPKGWWCSRAKGHMGPCAARPEWWNIKWRIKVWDMR